MPRIPLLPGAVALLLAMQASAEVFRWTDEHGVVNYGSRPPPGSNAKPIDAENSRVSVVPAPAKPAAAAPSEQSALRDRVQRLESQVEEQRRLRAQVQAAEDDRLARARADCEAQRRVNCDSDPFGSYEPTIIVNPVRRPIIVKPHHPPVHRHLPFPPVAYPAAPMRSSVPYRR